MGNIDLKKIIDDSCLYVYDKHEVILTGRKAVKKIKDAFSPTGAYLTDTLLEIEPIDPDVQWKVFVRPEELYLITKD